MCFRSPSVSLRGSMVSTLLLFSCEATHNGQAAGWSSRYSPPPPPPHTARLNTEIINHTRRIHWNFFFLQKREAFSIRYTWMVNSPIRHNNDASNSSSNRLALVLASELQASGTKLPAVSGVQKWTPARWSGRVSPWERVKRIGKSRRGVPDIVGERYTCLFFRTTVSFHCRFQVHLGGGTRGCW